VTQVRKEEDDDDDDLLLLESKVDTAQIIDQENVIEFWC